MVVPLEVLNAQLSTYALLSVDAIFLLSSHTLLRLYRISFSTALVALTEQLSCVNHNLQALLLEFLSVGAGGFAKW